MAKTTAKKTTTKTAKKTTVKKTVVKATKEAPAKATPVKAEEKAIATPLFVKRTGNYFYANGKRKTSVACVRLYSNGTGAVTINTKPFEVYFPVFTDQDKILSPLRVANLIKAFDISVLVHGGGIHSQAEAVRHGIAKALLAYDAALRSILKPIGFITRDSRVKERKKYGLKRARRAPQWQKR